MNTENNLDEVITKTDNKINITANNLEIDCITNANNKFSLDSDGNLIVNSITTNTTNNTTIDFDSIYPIGSIYLSVNNTNPSTLFGGTWEQISGYYLYAGDSTGTGGSKTTGAASGNTGSTSLNVSQLPSHNHSIPSLSGTAASNGAHVHKIKGIASRVAGSWNGVLASANCSDTSWDSALSAGAHTHSVTTNASTSGSTGSTSGHTHTLNSHTHTIDPIRYNVFAFKRVS